MLFYKKNPHAKVLTSIKPNQPLQFLVNKHRLEQLKIPMDSIHTLVIARNGQKYTNHVESKKTTPRNQYITAVVRGSLYTTAQRLNIPSKLIRQMTEILHKEVDFAHGIRNGDQFSIIYDAEYIETKW